MKRNVKIINDLGHEFVIPHALIPLCAQCLDKMRYESHFFTSQSCARVSFICHHKLSTRTKSITYTWNKIGDCKRW